MRLTHKYLKSNTTQYSEYVPFIASVLHCYYCIQSLSNNAELAGKLVVSQMSELMILFSTSALDARPTLILQQRLMKMVYTSLPSGPCEQYSRYSQLPSHFIAPEFF